MNKGQKWLEALAHRLELPAQTVAGLPKLELVGFSRLMIESHKGVLQYDQDKISVSVTTGVVHIEGKNLSIDLMNHQYLRVGGTISAVHLEGNHG